MRLRYDHQGLPMILLSTMKARKLVPKIPGLLMSDMVCNLKSETYQFIILFNFILGFLNTNINGNEDLD